MHVLSSNSFSGAENVVCQIIRMSKNEKSIEMVYSSPDGSIREYLDEAKIEYQPIKKINPRFLKAAIKKQRPDIIHAHDMKASFVAALSCGEIPLVCHIHNNAFDSRKISAKSLAFLMAANKAEHIFWVSDSAYKGYEYHDKISEKSSVLFNVIDISPLEEYINNDKDYLYDIVFVGRLTYQKNPQRFVELINNISQRMPKVKACMLGDGEDRDTLSKSDNIKMQGFIKNPAEIMSKSKVMLMTSRWEGTPMAALEAMALGVPIVTTPVDGMRDLITNGFNGFMGQENSFLIEKTEEIINSPELREQLSKNQKETFARINDVKKYWNRISKIYHDAIQKSKVRYRNQCVELLF